METKDYVWYACYGSNLSDQRFKCYLKGGKPEGAKGYYEGSRDQTPPLKAKPIQLPYELYFAKSSDNWHKGGVAFLNPQHDAEQRTFGRRYLITKTQFEDVFKQENHLNSAPKIDFDKVKDLKQLTLSPNTWYGMLLFIGEDEGCPIFTFTNPHFLSDDIHAPDINYLSTIHRGLSTCYGLSKDDLQTYFYAKQGIKDFVDDRELRELLP